MQPGFLQTRENLVEILRNCQDFANVSTLTDFFSIFRSDSREILGNRTDFARFLENTVIFTRNCEEYRDLPRVSPPTRHFFEIFQENVAEMLAISSKNYVQTFGYELQGTRYCAKSLNLANLRVIFSRFFEDLLEFLGESAIQLLFSRYFVHFYKISRIFLIFSA